MRTSEYAATAQGLHRTGYKEQHHRQRHDYTGRALLGKVGLPFGGKGDKTQGNRAQPGRREHGGGEEKLIPKSGTR
jgi:hypothetical protein